MQMIFTPQRRKNTLTLDKAGDVLTINDESFDFSGLPEGGALPFGSVPCDLINGDVRRDGELIVPLILPFATPPNGDYCDPKTVTVTTDGPVDLAALQPTKQE